MDEPDSKSIPDLGQLVSAFDRPIAFHPIFVDITGSINAALFLSQALYWSKRATLPEGWFYKIQSEWENETKLSAKQQATARKELRQLNILHEKLEGIPAQLYFKVNTSRLATLIVNVQTSISQTDILASPKRLNSDSPNGETIYTETTHETTSETTTSRASARRAKQGGGGKPSPLTELLASARGVTFISHLWEALPQKREGDKKMLARTAHALLSSADGDLDAAWDRAQHAIQRLPIGRQNINEFRSVLGLTK